jgi:hypothetical protein
MPQPDRESILEQQIGKTRVLVGGGVIHRLTIGGATLRSSARD